MKKANPVPRRIIHRVIVLLGVLAVSLAALGVLQAHARRQAYARLGAPGRFVAVEGRRVHVIERGRSFLGQRPTVVLETGWGGMSVAWQHVLEDLARDHHVVAYDRAGHGLSEDHDGAHDGGRIARDLHRLLRAIDAPAPYVLVGHSLGGPYARAYAAAYPEEVAALVLVDASHPDQRTRSAAVRAQMDASTGPLEALPWLADAGILRATGLMQSTADGLTGTALAIAREALADPRHVRAARAEMRAWERTMEVVRRAPPLGDVPVLVLTAGDVGRSHPDFAALQSEFLSLSTQSAQWTVDGADHMSLVLDARHAAHVGRAARAVVCSPRCVIEATGAVTSGRRSSGGAARAACSRPAC